MSGTSLYNINLPINLARLENDRLKLVPLEADLKRLSGLYVTETSKHPELFQYVPMGPFTQEEFEHIFDAYIHADSGSIMFAILLKETTVRRPSVAAGAEETLDHVDEGTFAGTIGLMGSEPLQARTEMGHIVILPRFQRTFVATQAHGLLLRHCLDPRPDDLGLRRVQWQANTLNVASITSAQRMGYQLEGIMRWQRANPPGRIGVGPEDEMGNGIPMDAVDGGKLGTGRHTAMLAICWDDWIHGGGRERVLELMDRRY